MPQKKSSKIKKTVTIFGALGYFSCLIQWLWCSVVILPTLLGSDVVQTFTTPPVVTNVSPIASFSPPPLVALVIGGLVTVVLLVVTILIIVRLPILATKHTQQTVDTSVSRAIKITTHGVPVPKKRGLILRIRYMIAIKIIITAIPFLLLSLAPLLDIALATSIVWITGIFFASWTIAWFGLQYVTAVAAKFPLSKLY